MGMPWDRAQPAYLERWVPRFTPYHVDFAEQLGLKAEDRVLVPSCGPGSDVIALARHVTSQAHGLVRGTDDNPSWVAVATRRLKEAALAGRAEIVATAPTDTAGGPWSVIACTFSLFLLPARRAALQAWAAALTPNGKVGVMLWGPAPEDDPYEIFWNAAVQIAPELRTGGHRSLVVDRAGMGAMFEEAGLAMVRHTMVSHLLTFPTAERFVDDLCAAASWRERFNGLGEARVAKIRAQFYEVVGGPTRPLTYSPPATIALAGLPGAEVELPHRPSVRIPAMTPPDASDE